MDELKRFLLSATPDWKAFSYALVGFLLNHIWAVFRNRRIPIAWTATFQRIAAVNSGPTNFKLVIQLDSVPCTNVQCCQINACNESGRDISAMDILITFNPEFSIVEATGSINTSAKTLLLSSDFIRTQEVVSAVPKDDRPRHPSMAYLLRNKEFHLPALNRGEVVSFLFWINSTNPNAVPTVNLTTEKVGVKMVSRPAEIRVFDWALAKRTMPFGAFVAVLLALMLSNLALSASTVAVISCLLGASFSLLGLWMRAIVRLLTRFV